MGYLKGLGKLPDFAPYVASTLKDSIDHGPGGRDDLANAAVGALVLASAAMKSQFAALPWGGVKPGPPPGWR